MFDLANELPKLSTANSNIMQMSTICIAVLLFAFGLVLLFYSKQILENKLGRLILLVLSLFYFTRLSLGFVYPQSGITMSIILVVCVLVYLIPALPSKQDKKE